MNVFQLVTRHLYFGVDAMRLQVAAGRILMRLQGQPPERATVGLDTLAQDFRLSPRESRNMVDEMLQYGLLERKNTSAAEFVVTDKFRLYARARIVDPLLRARAQLLLGHMGDMAQRTSTARRRAANMKSRRSPCMAAT